MQNQDTAPIVSDSQSNLLQVQEEDSCQHTATAFHCVKVVEIYDGDTIFVDIDKVHPLLGKRIGVRFAEIDAPELQTTDICERKKALKAKALVEEFVNKAKRIDVVDVKRDQYFRIVGTVLFDRKSISDEIIGQDLANHYYGGKKLPRDWCN